MSVLDDILQAVSTSTKLDAGTKSVLTQFLQDAGPALATLAPGVVQDVMASFAAGDSASAITPLSNAMTEEQVIAALGTTEQQMDAAVDQRATQVAAARATLAAVENAAVSVLARLLISAL